MFVFWRTGLRDAPNDVHSFFFFALQCPRQNFTAKNGIPDQKDGIYTLFQTKMAKSIPYCRLEMLEDDTLWGGYGFYMGELNQCSYTRANLTSVATEPRGLPHVSAGNPDGRVTQCAMAATLCYVWVSRYNIKASNSLTLQRGSALSLLPCPSSSVRWPERPSPVSAPVSSQWWGLSSRRLASWERHDRQAFWSCSLLTAWSSQWALASSTRLCSS